MTAHGEAVLKVIHFSAASTGERPSIPAKRPDYKCTRYRIGSYPYTFLVEAPGKNLKMYGFVLSLRRNIGSLDK